MQRKYFGTDGVRGQVGAFPITPEFVLKLGWAAGTVFARQANKRGKVVIGKDTRISGYMFESALEAGLSAAGVDIYLLGPLPTPAVAYITHAIRADAGIVISASHNPYHDNGIKFFSANGTKLPDAVELAIEAQIDTPMETVASEQLGRARRIGDANTRYVVFCKNTFPFHLSLDGLRIVLDCSNGAAYQCAPQVFRELGAEVLELAVNPDGLNINENCGATHLEMLQKIVLVEEADVGIAMDGDADRVIMVDHKGEVVDGDHLLFMIANYLKRHQQLGGGVVGTVMSNLGLEESLKKNRIPFVRSKVGDRYVMEKLLQRQWKLGGESSGHIICLDQTTTGDGIIAALQALAALVESGKSLHELKQGMEKLPQELINVRCAHRIDVEANQNIQKAKRRAEKTLRGHGRVLLRASGTEPVIRVMVEGHDPDRIRQVATDIATVVEQEAAVS